MSPGPALEKFNDPRTPPACEAYPAKRCSASWLPMDTAPKDGTEILAWRKDCGILLVRWDAPENFMTDRECEEIGECAEQYDWMYADFVAGGRLEGDEAPTHWMPLPNEPNAGGEGREV